MKQFDYNCENCHVKMEKSKNSRVKGVGGRWRCWGFATVWISFLWSPLAVMRYLWAAECVCVGRYCPQCKVDTSEVVLAGERLKESKKKGKMASSQSATSRDWGKVNIINCCSIALHDAVHCALFWIFTFQYYVKMADIFSFSALTVCILCLLLLTVTYT